MRIFNIWVIDELNINNRHPPFGILIYGLVIIVIGWTLLVRVSTRPNKKCNIYNHHCICWL